MEKHEIILTVSKVRSRNGNFSFLIKTNLPIGTHTVRLPENGKLIDPGIYRSIKDQLTGTLSVIFNSAKHHLNVAGAVSYKFIFSDRFIATGLVPVQGTKTESYSEISLPILESEAVFVFGCIPSNC